MYITIGLNVNAFVIFNEANNIDFGENVSTRNVEPYIRDLSST